MLHLQPRTVVVGIYFGNDITGTYDSAYVRNLFPEYRSKDPQVLKAIATARAAGSLRDLAVARGMRDARRQQWSGITSWLKHSSSLYAIGRAVKIAVFDESMPPDGQFEETFEKAAQRFNYFPLSEPPF